MISVEQAAQTVLENTIALEDEIVPLPKAYGRVLREDLYADRDFPPFDRVAMDGIGICFQAFEAGKRSFLVEALQAAGAPQLLLESSLNCLEVMTGAVLPANADTVVRYEDVEITNGRATIKTEDVRPGQNVHRQGSDRSRGEIVVTTGCQISSAEIGVSATIGKTELRVSGLPRVAIVSTGDELVDIVEMPLPHQIRKSNVHTLAAEISALGMEPLLLHLPDERNEIREKLAGCLSGCDVLILSGGVSAGKLDYVPEVLHDLGVEKLFHKVAQRPGKPFWFGKKAGDVVVFALPGNPVSSFVCLHRYFLPWLRKSIGLKSVQRPYAVLTENFSFKPSLTYFLQVKLGYGKDGTLTATPQMGGGSGDLANLADADAFIELPSGQPVFAKGDVFPVLKYRQNG